RDRVVTSLYFTHIALAEQELSVANVGRAEELLEACPEPLRNWEWHYLKRRRYGEPLPLRGPRGYVVGSVAFSPDGRRLAAPFSKLSEPLSGGLLPGVVKVLSGRVLPPGVVKVLDTTTGQGLETLEGPSFLASVAYSPNGRYLAMGGQKFHLWRGRWGEVILWDTQTGKERFPPWRGAEGTIALEVAFSPDGRWLAASFDNM